MRFHGENKEDSYFLCLQAFHFSNKNFKNVKRETYHSTMPLADDCIGKKISALIKFHINPSTWNFISNKRRDARSVLQKISTN